MAERRIGVPRQLHAMCIDGLFGSESANTPLIMLGELILNGIDIEHPVRAVPVVGDDPVHGESVDILRSVVNRKVAAGCPHDQALAEELGIS